jgi:hypothetical protein
MLCYVLTLFFIQAPAQSNIHGTVLREQSLNNVTCIPNTFWLSCAIPANPTAYIIKEYNYNNGIITNSSSNTIQQIGYNIAYCNDFTNGTGKTFYDIDTDSSNKLLRYNGNSWIYETQCPLNLEIANCAGNNNTLVFEARDTGTANFIYILTYFNNNFNLLYTCDLNTSISVRDLAVDSQENIWFIKSDFNSSTNPNKLCSISKLGVLQNEFPIVNSNFNPFYTYGMFILNNTLFIGVDAQDPIYPQKLLPFTILNDTAVMAAPILFNAPSIRADLESCNQGTLTSISEVPESLKELSVYPNPAQDQFMLHLPYRTSKNATIQIYNLQGELVTSIKASDTSPINCSTWPRGVYFVLLVEEGKARVTRKIVVI